MLLLVACADDVETYRLSGTVEATTIELTLPVSETLLAIDAEEGQAVAAGQSLLRFDATIAEHELAAARALARVAEAARTEAETDLRRGEGLAARRVVAPSELDRSRSRFDQAEAVAAERRARVAVAEKRLADLTVRAPFAATVDEIPFVVGERVAAGSVIAALVGEGEPWVRIWLPARAAALATPGAKATITIAGIDSELHGRLTKVSRKAAYTPHFAYTEREGAHLVYSARVAIDDAPEGLRPGVAAQVRLALPRGQPAASAEPAVSATPAAPAE